MIEEFYLVVFEFEQIDYVIWVFALFHMLLLF